MTSSSLVADYPEPPSDETLGQRVLQCKDTAMKIGSLLSAFLIRHKRPCVNKSEMESMHRAEHEKSFNNIHGVVTKTKVYQASIIDHCNLLKCTYVYYYFIKYVIAPDCFVTSQ
jgi:hypothetical protein